MNGNISVSLAPAKSINSCDIHDIFCELITYSLNVDGLAKRDDATNEFLNSRPSGCEPHHKYAFLAKCGGKPIGLLDIINGYPSPGTAFIGLLAIRESMQGLGLGRAVFRAAERFAQVDLKARALRLAIVETNPVMAFWIKMGFRATGEVNSFIRGTVRSRSILMEKALQLDSSSR